MPIMEYRTPVIEEAVLLHDGKGCRHTAVVTAEDTEVRRDEKNGYKKNMG